MIKKALWVTGCVIFALILVGAISVLLYGYGRVFNYGLDMRNSFGIGLPIWLGIGAWLIRQTKVASFASAEKERCAVVEIKINGLTDCGDVFTGNDGSTWQFMCGPDKKKFGYNPLVQKREHPRET